MRAWSALLLALLGCASGGASEAALAMDAACAAEPSPLVDARFPSGDGTLALRDLSVPCTAPAGALVVRVLAPWCGSCSLLLASPHRDRVSLVDALIANAENAEPDLQALRDHRARPGAAEHALIDPEGKLLAPFPARVALPLVLIFDARSLALRTTLSAATPEVLDAALARVLGEPLPESAPRVDGRFSPSTWSLLSAMAFPALSLPAGPAGADDPRAAALGRALFFEPALSPAGVSCGSCHQRERGLASPDPTAAQGVGAGSRNVPSVGFAAYQRYQFWDGRADSLLMQAVAPFENPAEMASSRGYVVRALAQRYVADYTALFGALPASAAELPDDAHPGTPSWTSLSDDERSAVTRAFSNAALTLVAFERALPRAATRLDAYLAGDTSALSELEKDGLAAFASVGCTQCHHGPLLSDGAFHNLRSATGRHDLMADPGRSEGVRLLATTERFGGELALDVPRVATAAMLGAFKTPPLRDVASTPPYGHGGGYASLRHVVELHRRGGEPETSRLAVGASERWLAPFDEAQRDAIVAFLAVLVGAPAP